MTAVSLMTTVANAVPAVGRNRTKDLSIGGPLPLPFPESLFTNLAASVQNTYCYDENNQPGMKLGDQTLLYTVAWQVTPDRVNIYYSDSMGIIMAYMGSNSSNPVSDLANLDEDLVIPDAAFGLPPLALVMQGLQDLWRLTWEDYVKPNLLLATEQYPNTSIIVTGHSQGAGIALVTAMAIAKELGPDSISHVITFGPPRAGNVFWADAFDSVFKGRYTGVTNGADWVSEQPPFELGYQHPSGMVWINPANSSSYYFYPDQEDLNGIDSRVPEYIDPASGKTYWGDHQGIYMGTSMGVMWYGPCPAIIGGF